MSQCSITTSMVIILIVFLGLVKDSTALTVELQQHGNPVMGSNGVRISCIAKTEEDEIVNEVTLLSKFSGNEFKGIIVFNIKDNLTVIIIPAGSYLKDRVTLKNLFSSENRTVVEYNEITCDDNTAYRCDVRLSNYNTETSNQHSMEVEGIPNKPDTIPIRTPGLNICPGMNVNYSCTGNVGTLPGYFRWTKIINGSTTIYNDTFNSDISGECNINRTSILSIEVQKEDNNASFKCEIIHDLATSDMFQQTIPEIFVYETPIPGWNCATFTRTFRKMTSWNDQYEYTVITKEPDNNFYDPTTPYIELNCFAHGCNLPNYTWYKNSDLNTTIGNDSLYRISDVSMENSGTYSCIVETIINGTEEKYNQSVTIDIRNIDQPEQLPIEGDGFADTAAGLVTIAVVSVGGVVLTSIVLFKIIQKVKHLRMLKTIGVKDVEIVNNADPDNEATQGIDDEGFVSEVSQQWQNNAPIQSTM